MDGLLLSHKEKQLKKEMFTTLSDAEPRYSSFKEAANTKRMLTSNTPEEHIQEVIEAVGTVTEICPTNKIKNLNKFCAGAAEVLCDKNNLSSFGARIVLHNIVENSKSLPSISEFDRAAQAFNQSIDDLETIPLANRFWHNEKVLLDRIKEAGVHLDDINKWSYVFPYNEILDQQSGKAIYNEYPDAVINQLSQPHNENVLLYLVETMSAFYDSIHNAFAEDKTPPVESICKKSITSEILKQFQEIENLTNNVIFLTPSQWKKFNWQNVKLTNKNWDNTFQPFFPSLCRVIANDLFNKNVGFDNNIYIKLTKMTKEHFEMEEMFK